MVSIILHPELRDPAHRDYKKAKIVAWAIALIFIFNIFYDIYFWLLYPLNIEKQYTNVIGLVMIAFYIVILRLSKSIKTPIGYLGISSLGPTMYSVYHTGGIYSADIAWLLLTIFGIFVFVDYKWGIIAASINIAYLIFLYLKEHNLPIQDNFFAEYIRNNSSTHNIFTIVTVICMTSILLTAFTRVLENTNKKLEKLTRDRIDELEIKLKEKTTELSELRSNLAKDFHDEMGNKLASITILSQSVALKVKENNQQEVAQLLESIQNRSKELYSGTKDFIWSIDFRSNYVDELFIYIRDFGETFYSPLDISFYSVNKFESGALARLNSDASRQLVFICKEIMTNAAKHANCNEVSFSSSRLSNQLQVEIKDNGKGFDLHKATTRGLKNIEKRIQLIGGKYTLSSDDRGTIFSIIIPLEQVHLS